jgi:hypothetical protein
MGSGRTLFGNDQRKFTEIRASLFTTKLGPTTSSRAAAEIVTFFRASAPLLKQGNASRESSYRKKSMKPDVMLLNSTLMVDLRLL